MDLYFPRGDKAMSPTGIFGPGALVLTLFVRDIRHDLPHLHRLTGRHLLNADDNLVIGGARRALKQCPKTL